MHIRMSLVVSVTLNIILLAVAGVYLLWPNILAWWYVDSISEGVWSDKLEYGPYCIKMKNSAEHVNDFLFSRHVRGENVFLLIEDTRNTDYPVIRRQKCHSKEFVRLGHLIASNISLSWCYNDKGLCDTISLWYNGKRVFSDMDGDGVGEPVGDHLCKTNAPIAAVDASSDKSLINEDEEAIKSALQPFQ